MIYIKRSWQLSIDKTALVEKLYFGSTLGTMAEADAGDVAALHAHIRAVRFVYVPNHARPADLIRQELMPLRGSLVARLRSTRAYRESAVEELFTELRAMGERMFGEVSEAVSRGVPQVAIEPDLPIDFADLVFTLGVRARTTDDEARSPEFEGSGAQSLMLLHVLNLADKTQRSTGFGWVQASVWAIEEPESFLHAALRVRFAEDLHECADDPKRQIFVTTHQDEFVRIAESAWFARRSPETTLSRMDSRAALMESSRAAISSYRHPLMTHPTEPIVIVEGKFDGIYLSAAIKEANLKPRWRLIAPDAAFGDGSGGDAVYEYLKYNTQVVASRCDAAPVIVLRDWESSRERAKYDKLLACHPYSRCLVAPAAQANPELGESFRGIERYLSTKLVVGEISKAKLGRESGELNAPFSIKPELLERSKPNLAAKVQGGTPVGPHMENLARWIDHQIVEILGEVPSSAFL